MLNESEVHVSTLLSDRAKVNASLSCFNYCHESELMRFDAIPMTIIRFIAILKTTNRFDVIPFINSA